MTTLPPTGQQHRELEEIRDEIGALETAIAELRRQRQPLISAALLHQATRAQVAAAAGLSRTYLYRCDITPGGLVPPGVKNRDDALVALVVIRNEINRTKKVLAATRVDRAARLREHKSTATGELARSAGVSAEWVRRLRESSANDLPKLGLRPIVPRIASHDV